MNTKISVYFILAALSLTACGEKEAPLPEYRQDLGELITDASGRGTHFVRDDGARFELTDPPAGFTADSLQRIIALYADVPAGQRLTLKSYTKVLSPQVTLFPEQIVRFDPVAIESVYASGAYINLFLLVKTGGQGHRFGIHQAGTIANADGSRTLCASLLHDQGNDPLYYSRRTLLCCPLRPLQAYLREGKDSIRLTVQTFEGKKSFQFAYLIGKLPFHSFQMAASY